MIINKFVMHVLDKNSDTPVLNDFECKFNNAVDKFLEVAIKKTFSDDYTRKAIFKNYHDNVIQQCTEQMLYNEDTFLENSKEIASFLFDLIKVKEDLTSGNIIICIFTIKDEKYVGIFKLDYKTLYTHSIEFIDDKFNIQMKTHDIGVPENYKPKQAAIISYNSINDDMHLLLLDKDFEKNELDSSFSEDFLNVEKVIDSKYKTKSIKNITDNVITNLLSNDIKQLEDSRSMVNYILKEKEDIKVEDFIDKVFTEDHHKDVIKECLEERNIHIYDNIEIDKVWVEKNLKKRTIKTDTGFEIKSNYANYEDAMKYSISKNDDGSVDIILKNIRFFE